MAKTMKAVDTCEFDLDDSSGGSGSGSASNTTGNSTGGRLLVSHSSSVAEKTAWDTATKKATTTYYSDKTCATASSKTPKEMDFGSDGTTCVKLQEGMYMKYDTHSVRPATAAGCDRMQSLFLLPLLAFLGVAKMIML